MQLRMGIQAELEQLTSQRAGAGDAACTTQCCRTQSHCCPPPSHCSASPGAALACKGFSCTHVQRLAAPARYQSNGVGSTHCTQGHANSTRFPHPLLLLPQQFASVLNITHSSTSKAYSPPNSQHSPQTAQRGHRHAVSATVIEIIDPKVPRGL